MPTECREPVDLVIALDSSFSIGPNNYLAMTDFIRDLVRDLPMQEDREVRVGFMAYSDRTEVRYLLSYCYQLRLIDGKSIL